MNSDNRKGRDDVRFVSASTGHYMNFRCGKCMAPKSMLGRKLQQVRGMRVWVCRACVV